MTEQNQENLEKDFIPQIYELGYHVISLVPEEEVLGEVENLKSILEKHGASFIGEEDLPKLISLAYKIDKKIANKKHIFDKAYFGWVKFEVNPLNLPMIHNEIKELENILRFLIIKTVRSSKVVAKRDLLKKAAAELKESGKDEKAKPTKEEKIGVDEAIDELVIE